MAQQQDGFAAPLAEVHLEMIACFLLAMNFDPSPEFQELVSQDAAELVASGFVVRRRFQQHKLLESGHHLALAWRQPVANLQKRGRPNIGSRWFGAGLAWSARGF